MSEWKKAAVRRREHRQGGFVESESKLSPAKPKTRKPFTVFVRYVWTDEAREKRAFLIRMMGDREVKLGSYKTLRAAEQASERERTACPFMIHCSEIVTRIEVAA